MIFVLGFVCQIPECEKLFVVEIFWQLKKLYWSGCEDFFDLYYGYALDCNLDAHIVTYLFMCENFC